MARRGGLSTIGISPFKQSTAGFSMFDAVSAGQEEYLAFTRVQVRWDAGEATDAEYLAALEVYANSLDPETSEAYNAQSRLRQARYTLARNAIVREVEAGTRPMSDLLEFDTQAILGLNPASQEYRDRSARLTSTKNQAATEELQGIRRQWEAGTVTDAAYLTAFTTYVSKLTNPDDQVAAQAQLDQLRYSLARDALVTKVNGGQATLAQLLTFDQQYLTGLVAGSSEYRDRLARLQNTQTAVFADQENDQQLRWQQGKITSAQLLRWYEDALTSPLASGNGQLSDRITGQVESLRIRVVDERDARMVQDFNDGKVGVNAFLVYANNARARYDPSTPQYREWSARIKDATLRSIEDNLVYRHDLTRQYADLKRFIASNSTPPTGTSTTSTRIIQDENGQWKVVSTEGGGQPSASELEAWRLRQIEVADAKKQLVEIAAKIKTLPGGWVDHKTMLTYYRNMQGTYAPGTSEWYAIQQRIDQIEDYRHQDQVYRQQGIVVTYPWTPNDPQRVTGGGGGGGSPNTTRIAGGVTVDSFMRSLAQSESGGNYNLTNSQSGAFGKYQHLPQHWAERADKYLGDAGAPMTPENQEKVTRAMATDYYKRYGDWRLVALAWRNGTGWVANNVGAMSGGSWSAKLDALIDQSAVTGDKWGQAYIRRIAERLGGSLQTPMTTSGVLAGNSNEWSGGGGTGGLLGSNLPMPRVTIGATPKVPATTPATLAPREGDTSPPAPPALQLTASQQAQGPGGLRVYTGDSSSTRHGIVPHTATAGLPDFAKDNPLSSGAGFEDFYVGYRNAYRAGETVFVVWTLSGPISYALSGSPAERQAQMDSLDQLRVDLHDIRATAYAQPGGDTDLLREAQQKWGQAILERGQNQMIGLTQPAGGIYARGELGSPENPIADASKLLADTNVFIARQTEMARAAFDRGDYGAAMAHIREAQLHADQMGNEMNGYLASAQAAIGVIQKNTAAPVPEKVASLLSDLQGWDTQLDTGDLEALSIELVGKPGDPTTGILKRDAAGNIAYDELTGAPVLRDGYALKLEGDKIVPENITGAGWIRDPVSGDLKPPANQKGLVRVTIRRGNTWVDAYAKYEFTQIGMFSDGTPIFGKAVVDPFTDSSVVENPFRPGTWSASAITVNLPPGARVINLDPANPQTAQIEFRSNDGTLYRIALGSGDSGYVVGQWNLTSQSWVEGRTQSFTSPSMDIGAWLTQQGFSRDVSKLTSDERLMAETSGAIIGASPAQYRSWITAQTPKSVPAQLLAPQNGYYDARLGRYVPPPTLSAVPAGWQQQLAGHIASERRENVPRPLNGYYDARLGRYIPPVVPQITQPGFAGGLSSSGSWGQPAPTINPYTGFTMPKVAVPTVKPPTLKPLAPLPVYKPPAGTGYYDPNLGRYVAPPTPTTTPTVAPLNLTPVKPISGGGSGGSKVL